MLMFLSFDTKQKLFETVLERADSLKYSEEYKGMRSALHHFGLDSLYCFYSIQKKIKNEAGADHTLRSAMHIDTSLLEKHHSCENNSASEKNEFSKGFSFVCDILNEDYALQFRNLPV